MRTRQQKALQDQNRSTSKNEVQTTSENRQAFQFVDNRPEAIAQRKLKDIASKSKHTNQLRVSREKINSNNSTSEKGNTFQHLQVKPEILQTKDNHINAISDGTTLPITQLLKKDGQDVAGGLDGLDPALRKGILQKYYNGRDLNGYVLEDTDFGSSLKLAEVNDLQDRLDALDITATTNLTNFDSLGNNIEGMIRPTQLNPGSPARTAISDTRADIKQLNNQISASRTMYGDANLPRNLLDHIGPYNVRVARGTLVSDAVLARKDVWEARFTELYNRAKGLKVQNRIDDVRNTFVLSALNAGVSIDTATNAFNTSLDTLTEALVVDANREGAAVGVDSLSVDGKEKAKSIFEDLLSSHDITLKAEAIYKSEFEVGLWDFGAEWLLRSAGTRGWDFISNWVLHGHMRADVPAEGEYGEKHNFSKATFTPKILHVKPIAHREDTGWSQTVDGVNTTELDPEGLKTLCKSQPWLFNTLSHGIGSSTGKYFTTASAAINTGTSYRKGLSPVLKNNIYLFSGGNPNAIASVDSMNTDVQALEVQSRKIINNANKEFVDKHIGGSSKNNWLKKNVVKKVKKPITDAFYRIDSFLSDPSVVKSRSRDYYKLNVLDKAKEANTEKLNKFDKTTDALWDLAE